jgi:hypothetical protein
MTQVVDELPARVERLWSCALGRREDELPPGDPELPAHGDLHGVGIDVVHGEPEDLALSD